MNQQPTLTELVQEWKASGSDRAFPFWHMKKLLAEKDAKAKKEKDDE